MCDVFTLIEAVLNAADIRDCTCIQFDVTNIDGDLICVGRSDLSDYNLTALPSPEDVLEGWSDEANRSQALDLLADCIVFDDDLADAVDVAAVYVRHPSGWMGVLYCCGDVASLDTLQSVAETNGRLNW